MMAEPIQLTADGADERRYRPSISLMPFSCLYLRPLRHLRFRIILGSV